MARTTMSFSYPYPRPSVTVDIVFLATDAGRPRILLIERASPPFAGSWALPGGFLELDEELEAAGRRELREETDVEIGGLLEVGTFGAVGRDPRGRTLTVAFVGVQVGEPPEPRAGDDASAARWHPLHRLPKLAFDHRDIIARSRLLLAARAATPDGLLELMPESFTLADLRAVHELALGRSIAAAAFAARLRRAGVVRPLASRSGRVPLYRRARR